MKHKGSCLCGKVAFEIEGDFQNFYLCHCEYCRKDTGSAHAANLFSTSASLQWLRGQEWITSYNHLGEGHVKSFCKVCGSALPNLQDEGKRLVVPAGCLDTAIAMRPQGHLFTKHRASWDNELETVHAFEELPN